MIIDLDQSKTQWSLKIKLARAFWTFGLQPIVRWLPKSCSSIRIFALRMMGASIGPRCLILPGVRVLMPWNLTLGHHVALGEGVNVYNFSMITVSNMTVISQNTFLCTGSHDFRLPDMPLIYAPINIGSESWIAADVFIGPGCDIPRGVVIGARAVVSKTLPDEWSIYAGNPCKKIGERKMKV